MRKVKRLWVSRDKNVGNEKRIWFFKEEPVLINGEFGQNSYDCLADISLKAARELFGIILKPGQKKQIEIREVK